jgi:hypothetical protein
MTTSLVIRENLARWGSVLCLLAAVSCARAELRRSAYNGAWTMRFGPRTFLVLTLDEKGGRFTGTLARPEHFQTGNTGSRFTRITGVTVREPIVSAEVSGDRLHFVTASSKNRGDTTAYDLALTSNERATLKLSDAPFDAWILTKAASGAQPAVSTDWDASMTYSAEDGLASNVEMGRLFEDDQKERQDFMRFSAQQRAALGARDAERRSRTRHLLDEGQLHSGEDFKRAAFIFQHGDTPDDHLLAHTLAMVAVAHGEAGAVWIGAATLDHYLQAIGQPQVYGTRFTTGDHGVISQEPYNRGLISDALRRQLDVPAIAVQLEQYQRAIGQPVAGTNGR